jgi:hypothetical protein
MEIRMNLKQILLLTLIFSATTNSWAMDDILLDAASKVEPLKNERGDRVNERGDRVNERGEAIGS